MKKRYIKPEFDFMEIKIIQDLLVGSAEDPNVDAGGDGDDWFNDTDEDNG